MKIGTKVKWVAPNAEDVGLVAETPEHFGNTSKEFVYVVWAKKPYMSGLVEVNNKYLKVVNSSI
jgi:hypothetical protein